MAPATGRIGDDVIIGYDRKPRCAWAGAADTALGRYHDEVWGTRTRNESALFEALTLGVFEAGLSWSIVFGKRDAFRRAFHEFDLAQVATMTEQDVDRLLQDSAIIRNRAKVQAKVQNARAMRSASPSLAELARSYETNRQRAPRSIADLPASTPQADAFAKQLKSQGYRFVGPTSVYAFMQNVGVVNDHVRGCFRATDYTQPPTEARRRWESPGICHLRDWRRRQPRSAVSDRSNDLLFRSGPTLDPPVGGPVRFVPEQASPVGVAPSRSRSQSRCEPARRMI
jgi:DNA-3-methyladenine glycosylase I